MENFIEIQKGTLEFRWWVSLVLFPILSKLLAFLLFNLGMSLEIFLRMTAITKVFLWLGGTQKLNEMG